MKDWMKVGLSILGGAAAGAGVASLAWWGAMKMAQEPMPRRYELVKDQGFKDNFNSLALTCFDDKGAPLPLPELSEQQLERISDILNTSFFQLGTMGAIFKLKFDPAKDIIQGTGFNYYKVASWV